MTGAGRPAPNARETELAAWIEAHVAEVEPIHRAAGEAMWLASVTGGK